jgi:hypothetical protein
VIVIGVFLLVAAAVLAALAVHAHSQAASEGERSAFTQAHGVRREATVDRIDVFQSAHGQDTSEVSVTLDKPVAGRTTTTVHVPGNFADAGTDHIAVLVDPQEPGYAEEPGLGSTSSRIWSAWVSGAALSGVSALAIAIRAASRAWLMRRSRRVT